MIIPIVHPSATEFWRNSSNLSLTNELSVQKRKLVALPNEYAFCSDNNIIKKISDRYGISAPAHVMVAKAAERRNNKDFISSVKPASMQVPAFLAVCKVPATYRSYLNEDSIVYMASPELCFLQAAADLSFYKLIQFGYELCAKYIIDKDAKFGQSPREQITSAQIISHFLDQFSYTNGLIKAKRASRFILNQSNSPMETILSMITIVPFSYGGFAIKHPSLNKSVKLSDQGKSILGRDECSCDLVWEEEKLIVEYDSILTHLSKRQHSIDKKRISALSLSGYTIISITPDKLVNYETAFEIFTSIRHALGMRSFDNRVKNHRELYYKMLAEIYPTEKIWFQQF